MLPTFRDAQRTDCGKGRSGRSIHDPDPFTLDPGRQGGVTPIRRDPQTPAILPLRALFLAVANEHPFVVLLAEVEIVFVPGREEWSLDVLIRRPQFFAIHHQAAPFAEAAGICERAGFRADLRIGNSGVLARLPLPVHNHKLPRRKFSDKSAMPAVSADHQRRDMYVLSALLLSIEENDSIVPHLLAPHEVTRDARSRIQFVPWSDLTDDFLANPRQRKSLGFGEARSRRRRGLFLRGHSGRLLRARRHENGHAQDGKGSEQRKRRMAVEPSDPEGCVHWKCFLSRPSIPVGS